MTNVPKISVVCSGIRVKSWKRFYENLSESKIEFELIIPGNVKPDFKLPSNFHFINTNVKPAQCVEIGVRKAKSDLIMILADDIKCSDNFLDTMYESYMLNCAKTDVISCLFMKFGKLWPSELYKFWPGVYGSPVLAMGMMMNKELWTKLGGLDKRFIAIYWDIDIFLRLLENGGKHYICKSAVVEEVFPFYDRIFLQYPSYSKLIKKLFFNRNLHPSLWRIYGKNIDRPTLENLWVKDIDNENYKIDKYYAKNNNLIHCKERLDQVHSFTNKNILQFSQGPKGKWD
tara:strand:+ start:53 stop:913 length:861 start_codon:yes stop_codon:yes gene_type:complete